MLAAVLDLFEPRIEGRPQRAGYFSLLLLNYSTAVCDDLKFPTFFQQQTVSLSRVISNGLPLPCKAEVVLAALSGDLSLRRQHNVGLDAIVFVKRRPTVSPAGIEQNIFVELYFTMRHCLLQQPNTGSTEKTSGSFLKTLGRLLGRCFRCFRTLCSRAL